jgi:hypothetical protein
MLETVNPPFRTQKVHDLEAFDLTIGPSNGMAEPIFPGTWIRNR